MFGTLVPRTKGQMAAPVFDPFSRMLSEMERFWGGNGDWLTAGGSTFPKMDVSETETHFEVTVDLPGLKPEEVNVEVKDGDLWISGEREEKKEEKDKTYHRVERHHGEFRRVISLPQSVDTEAIEATFDNGSLHVNVPKREQAKTKSIKVKKS